MLPVLYEMCLTSVLGRKPYGRKQPVFSFKGGEKGKGSEGERTN